MMTLSPEQLTQLAELACQCATDAGQLIETKFGQGFVTPRFKESGYSKVSSVVTDADILSQETILNALKSSLAEYDFGLLAEETDDDGSRLRKDFFWSIDPLDGTLPFTEGRSGYSVVISLISRSGLPYLGVIYDPKDKVLYHAIRGQGAFKNREPFQLRNNGSSFTLVMDRSFAQHVHYDQTIKMIKETAGELGLGDLKTICQGGAAMNAMWVLENLPACYLKLPRQSRGGGCIWDFAASVCFFHELGASALGALGQPLHFNRPETLYFNETGVLFGSFVGIDQFINRLRDLLSKDL